MSGRLVTTDVLVIGRAVTQADSPTHAAEQIVAELLG